jgi:para-aminobenzoate synthetase component 1
VSERLPERTSRPHRALLSRLLKWSSCYPYCALLHSNGIEDPAGQFDWFFAVGKESFSSDPADLKAFDEWLEANNDAYVLGVLSYDLRLQFEALNDRHVNELDQHDIAFFKADAYVYCKEGTIQWQGLSETDLSDGLVSASKQSELIFTSKTDPPTYAAHFERIREMLQLGSFYEMNFCRHFTADDLPVGADFWERAYLDLIDRQPTVQSGFFRFGAQRVLSASPERFLRRRGDRLLSEPIKGTLSRSEDPAEDQRLKRMLSEDEKERSENVMIVDLVRNDLSRVCRPGSVHAEELFSIRSLPNVHQMVSVVSGTLDSDRSFSEILQATFPMGSMTGAPKIAAMQAADQLESFRRGWYSGAMGYRAPGGDFDLNVLIRTLFVNVQTAKGMVGAGGAITVGSECASEFRETQWKAESIIHSLGGRIQLESQHSDLLP